MLSAWLKKLLYCISHTKLHFSLSCLGKQDDRRSICWSCQSKQLQCNNHVTPSPPHTHNPPTPHPPPRVTNLEHTTLDEVDTIFKRWPLIKRDGPIKATFVYTLQYACFQQVSVCVCVVVWVHVLIHIVTFVPRWLVCGKVYTTIEKSVANR